jgi:1,4-dihydroxy-2-naphthoate octaprenyltransferase
LFGASLILLLIFTLLNYSDQLANIEFWQYFLVIFPVILAILYYGLPTGGTQKYSLRNSGWLKPFVIAYVWTSTTCLYPVLLRQLEIDAFHFTITNQLAFHCFRQFIFISITAILFDIKDYKDDFNRELKTLVVRLGVNRTVSFVIIPFIIAGVALDLYYTDSYQSHFWTSIICIIPYLVMLWLSINLLQHKSIFYYLVMIDGLLLLKAVVDVTGFMIYKRMI